MSVPCGSLGVIRSSVEETLPATAIPEISVPTNILCIPIHNASEPKFKMTWRAGGSAQMGKWTGRISIIFLFS